MDLGSFLTEAFSVVHNFDQLSPQFKLIGILTLLISVLKVSAFNQLWHRLGWFKTFLAPFLSFLLAIVSSVHGQMNLTVIMNALLIGFGSVGFHEMLDALKNIPGFGLKWMLIVSFISQIIKDTSQFLSDFMGIKKPIEKK